ncbi:MAG: ATP-binding protein [Crenarchaeota archaeon]|nr:ATP-binding protein [Thermoproteota archaeon]
MERRPSPGSRELGEIIGVFEGLRREYEERYRAAFDAARGFAYTGLGVDGVVGYVSAVEEVRAGEVPVDVPPNVWVRVAHRLPQAFSPGFYYCIVDPKTMLLVLAVVREAVRVSGVQAVGARLPPIYPAAEEGTAIGYNIVSMRLILRPTAAVKLVKDDGGFSLGAPASPSTPPDPNSPVFIPKPWLVSRLLGPAVDSGVVVGVLGVMDQPYIPGEPIALRLPWSVMVKHVLVTGTTGSGKTSLVKNMLLSAVEGGANALVLDANGDYVAGLYPGYIPGERIDERVVGALRAYGVEAEPGRELVGRGLRGLIVIPCPRGKEGEECRDGEAEKHARSYAERLRRLGEHIYRQLLGDGECSVVLEDVEGLGEHLYRVRLSVDCGPVEGVVEAGVALRCVEIGGRVELLGMIDPYMTQKAREELGRIYRAFRKEVEGDGGFYEFVEWVLDNTYHLVKDYKVHKETLAALQRRLIVLRDSRLIDSGAPGIDYRQLLRDAERLGARLIILDLEYAAEKTPEGVPPTMAKVFLGYQALRSLARSPPPGYTLVVVDEAHLFFPRSSEGYGRVLSEQLERLARLGRARGISLVFSTHREDDVSNLLVTLANTKIYMRCDRNTAEKLKLPREYAQALPFFADHAAVLASYAVRGGFATIINAPPVIGHRTV